MSPSDESPIVSGQDVGPLEHWLRATAEELLQDCLWAEAARFLRRYADHVDEQGRAIVVRNGSQRSRSISTSLGDLRIRPPRIQVRGHTDSTLDIPAFRSSVTPPYKRQHSIVAPLFAWACFRAILVERCHFALTALLGPEHYDLADDLAPEVQGRWAARSRYFRERSLDRVRAHAFWIGAITQQQAGDLVAGDHPEHDMLVVLAIDRRGVPDLLTVHDGDRNSIASWIQTAETLRIRGLKRLSLHRLVSHSDDAARHAIECVLPGSMAPTEAIDLRMVHEDDDQNTNGDGGNGAA